MCLQPHMRQIIDVETGKDILPWTPGNEVLLAKFLKQPLLPNNMTILFWNVRRLGRPSFKQNLRMLLKQQNPYMVILVETRLCRQATTTTIEIVGFDFWHIVEPRGFARGVVLLWNATNLKFHVVGGNSQGVHGVVEVSHSTNSFVLSAIYASPKYVSRKLLWQDLCKMSESITYPWLAIGDFNEIISQDEKFGGQQIKKNRANLYASNMNLCNLLDMGTKVKSLHGLI